MRIRRSLTSPVSPSSALTPSPSSCSSSSSCFSSHSTISTHSLSSSSNSTSSSSSPSAATRCHGLDLLVKAVYYVAGSVIGVPYIQRRVIRRRKPALRFANLVINSDHAEVGDFVDDVENVVDFKITDSIEISKKVNKGSNVAKKKPQQRRSKGVPLKYNDSVLQALKPRDRRRRRSSK